MIIVAPKKADFFAIKGKIADEQGIRDVAQKIQNCCWQMAVLVDKLNPVKGSLRERIKSTVS